jgi:hypothetical protein
VTVKRNGEVLLDEWAKQVDEQLSQLKAKVNDLATVGPLVDFGNPKTAATAWGATIAGLTGAAGLVTLYQGDRKISGLEDGAQKLTLGFLFVALLLGIYAVAQAFFAANATSEQGSTWETLLLIRGRAIDRLWWSMRATAVAVVIVVGALAYAWTGPQDPSKQAYLVIYDSGSTRCGELNWDANGQLMDPNDPTAPASAVQISKVDECPKRNP